MELVPTSNTPQPHAQPSERWGGSTNSSKAAAAAAGADELRPRE